MIENLRTYITRIAQRTQIKTFEALDKVVAKNFVCWNYLLALINLVTFH